jgi:hypothetical protein
MGDRGDGLGIRIFFFNYNGLRGFHEALFHPKVGGCAILGHKPRKACVTAMTFR